MARVRPRAGASARVGAVDAELPERVGRELVVAPGAHPAFAGPASVKGGSPRRDADAEFRSLAPLGPVLDGVADPVPDALGLSFGEADLTVHGVVCPARRATPILVG